MSAWIRIIHEDEAEGELKASYDKIGGEAANIVKVSSLNPASLDGHMNLYKALMFKPSPLSRALREMIATVVSSVNECEY